VVTVGETRSDRGDILNRLERLPMTWVQGRLLMMGGLGYTFDAANHAALAFILPPVATLFALSNGQTGLLGSSVLIGYLFGAFAAGALGDLIGRKSVMLYALAIYCTATMIAACATSWHFLFWTRVIAGIGTGAESAIVAPYLSEFVQSKYRGRYIGSLAGFFSFGFVLAALLGYFVVPSSPQGWRIVQFLTAVPIVLLLWWRRALPESPRWLIEHGRSDDADEIVLRMETETERRTGRELLPAVGSPISGTNLNFEESLLGNLSALWTRGQRRNTLMLWGLWFSITFSYYGFFTWIPTLLVKQGLTVTKSYGYSIVIFVAQIPGYYSAAFISEKLDRKWTITSYMVGGGISAMLMANAHEGLLITFFGFFLSFFMNGTYAALYSYTPEIYPTSFRATGMGVASAFGRIGGIVAPIIIGFAFARIGFAGVFTITTVVLLCGACVVAAVGITTKGKTLEEIAQGVTAPEAVSLIGVEAVTARSKEIGRATTQIEN
jgi:MFS transporter, putative metabolite:H+ symporter